jgi:hypothetical protein
MFVNSCEVECAVPDHPIDSIKGLMELVLGMLALTETGIGGSLFAG